MVTSHIADWISRTWVTFLALHNRSRSHFRFRKRMWRHPRWRTEAEMAPAPVMERWESYLHYYWRPHLVWITTYVTFHRIPTVLLANSRSPNGPHLLGVVQSIRSPENPGTTVMYEVRDLFPWEMITKMVISFLLNVEKIWNSAQINLSSTLKFLLKILFRRNNIHRDIHHWNRRWFGAKWHVTVPNSVAPVKHIVGKWIYMSQG